MINLTDDVKAHLKSFEVTEQGSAPVSAAEVFAQFPASRRLVIPEERLMDWIKEADYENEGPSWWSQFSEVYVRKMLEHYASIELVDVKPGGTYLDAASSASPFYRVVRRTHGAALCYGQDLNRGQGIHDDFIGSDASNIPLPDESLDGIVSHNSWEHFEGESAMGFIGEAVRLLKPGAKLCILPINFREKTEIWTSPSVWASKYVNAPDAPNFDRRAMIVIKEEITQRQVMWWNPADLAGDLKQFYDMDFEIVLVESIGKMYALVGTKR